MLLADGSALLLVVRRELRSDLLRLKRRVESVGDALAQAANERALALFFLHVAKDANRVAVGAVPVADRLDRERVHKLGALCRVVGHEDRRRLLAQPNGINHLGDGGRLGVRPLEHAAVVPLELLLGVACERDHRRVDVAHRQAGHLHVDDEDPIRRRLEHIGQHLHPRPSGGRSTPKVLREGIDLTAALERDPKQFEVLRVVMPKRLRTDVRGEVGLGSGLLPLERHLELGGHFRAPLYTHLATRRSMMISGALWCSVVIRGDKWGVPSVDGI